MVHLYKVINTIRLNYNQIWPKKDVKNVAEVVRWGYFEWTCESRKEGYNETKDIAIVDKNVSETNNHDTDVLEQEASDCEEVLLDKENLTNFYLIRKDKMIKYKKVKSNEFTSSI